MEMEKVVETKEELKEIESLLEDFEDIPSLISIIRNIFSTFAIKVRSKKRKAK